MRHIVATHVGTLLIIFETCMQANKINECLKEKERAIYPAVMLFSVLRI